METLVAVARQIILIVLLGAFLEMLLPNQEMARFVRLVIGLFIIVSVLNPLMTWINGGQPVEVQAWEYVEPVPQTESILAQGERLRRQGEEIVLGTYSDRLARQMEVMVELLPEVEEAHLAVDLVGQQIEVGARVKEGSVLPLVEDKIKETLATFFDWPTSSIQVQLTETR